MIFYCLAGLIRLAYYNVMEEKRQQETDEKRKYYQGLPVKAEGAMYASKVMPICPKCGKAVRVGHVEKDGKMVRVCKKCGAEL